MIKLVVLLVTMLMAPQSEALISSETGKRLGKMNKEVLWENDPDPYSHRRYIQEDAARSKAMHDEAFESELSYDEQIKEQANRLIIAACQDEAELTTRAKHGYSNSKTYFNTYYACIKDMGLSK